MLYITGDTHIPIDIGKLNTKKFSAQKELTQNDYVIICGDFGGVWDGSNEEKYWIKWLTEKNFTTLFVDGNHENFDMLNAFPVVEFCGGFAHKINDKIYHLMRGEVFNIDGKKIFTFGGASSHDKEYRKEGKNWWKEELPDEKELKNAMDNLGKAKWNIDYVITHCAPNFIQLMFGDKYKEDLLTNFFESMKEKLMYKKWFFGHYHVDKEFDEKHICLYDKIIKIN